MGLRVKEPSARSSLDRGTRAFDVIEPSGFLLTIASPSKTEAK